MTAERRTEYLRLDNITGAIRNPKQHDGGGIAASIGKFGMAELPLLDERTGRLVAGHGRIDQLRAMRDAGQDPPDGIHTDPDGSWMVPVTRGWASRSDPEAEAYLAASNNLTTRGGWDDQELAAMLSDLADVDPDLLTVTGFTPDDLAALLDAGNEAEEVPPGGLTDPDDVPGVAANARTVPGDLWLLGPHRLLCGDTTNPDHVGQALDGQQPGLVFTDPPYGINAVPRDGGISRGNPVKEIKAAKERGVLSTADRVPAQKYVPVTGDTDTATATATYHLLAAAYPNAVHVWWGGNHYTASAALPDASCWLVWDKDNSGDFADAELAWTNHPGPVRLLKHMWNGMLRASERGKRVHPTQKPVALAVWAFEQVDSKGERRVVFDGFAGSGSTLIACHQTNRVGVLMELEPVYCDVICRRWQEHTGMLPVLAATGERVDFTIPAE